MDLIAELEADGMDWETSALDCITPGNPYVLHCFPSFKSEPTSAHLKHLDLVADRIAASFRSGRPITQVVAVGHSSTWHATSRQRLEERAVKRAGLIAAELVIRLGPRGLAAKVDVAYEGRSDREKWKGLPYSSTSTSRSAQRDRSMNRRVELRLIHSTSKPKPTPAPKARPLSPQEMEEAVFTILGRKPRSKARENLFRDIIGMMPKFISVVRGGAIPWAALTKAYIDIWRQEFGSERMVDFWYLSGSAYAAVDPKPRDLSLGSMLGITRPESGDRDRYRKAFRAGYRNFRKIQNRLVENSMGKAALSHMRARIAETPRRFILAIAAYRALRAIYLEDHPNNHIVNIKDNPRFRYPRYGTS